MATKEKRHVCKICGRKLIESKMLPVRSSYSNNSNRTAFVCLEKCPRTPAVKHYLKLGWRYNFKIQLYKHPIENLYKSKTDLELMYNSLPQFVDTLNKKS